MAGTGSANVPQDERPKNIRDEEFEVESPTVQSRRYHGILGIKGTPPVSGSSGNPYDYEQKYGEDARGEELDSSARAWRVLLDEGQAYDAAMIEGWRDTLDVHLVFAGLFSAVVTTLVVQSSQALQPDPSQTVIAMLSELIAVQRASASGISVNAVPSSSLSVDSVTASAVDLWGNRLWFLSLALSLFAAFVAVLIKQWLQAYKRAVSGHAKHRVLVRQYRLIGMRLWKVPFIIALLPTLLHGSLMLFSAGLVLFIHNIDPSMAWVVAALTALVYLLYFLSNLLPMLYPQCPFQTPVSYYGHVVLRYAFACVRGLVHGRVSDWLNRFDPDRWTPRSREGEAVKQKMDDLTVRSLAWALSMSFNPTVTSIIVQAASCLPFKPSAQQTYDRFLRQHVAAWFLAAVDAKNDGGVASNGRYGLCVTRVLDAVEEGMRPRAASDALPDSDLPVLESIALALASTRFLPPLGPLERLFPFLFPKPSSATEEPAFSHTGDVFWRTSSLAGPTPPTYLRLHPIIWNRMLSYLAYGNYLGPSRNCLHLAIFLWRSMDPAKVLSGPKRPTRGIVTLRMLCLSDSDVSTLALRAIHRLLCPLDCRAFDFHDHRLDKEAHNAILLHILNRAIEDYTRHPDEVRSAVSAAVFDGNTGFLARSFATLLAASPDEFELLSVVLMITGLPGVSFETHRSLFSHYHSQFTGRAFSSITPLTATALLRFVLKLLSSPVVLSKFSITPAVHFDSLRMLAAIMSRLQHTVAFEEAAKAQIDLLDVLHPAATAVLDDPELLPHAQVLCQILAPYIGQALGALFAKGGVTAPGLSGDGLDLNAAYAQRVLKFESRRRRYLLTYIWLDVISMGLSQAPSPLHSALHRVVRDILPALPPQPWCRILLDTVAQPLPLALGMRLADIRILDIYHGFLKEMHSLKPDAVSDPPDSVTLQRHCHALVGTNERRRLCALAHAVQASDDAIQPITKLATIEEYTRKMDELRQKDVQEANQRTHQDYRHFPHEYRGVHDARLWC
ncbi:hypothetical protein EV714DRAFT_277213 [Schizophyllum commune]